MGCDAGPAHDETPGGPPILITANVSATQPLAPDGRIEIASSRYLLPSLITRQTFALLDAQMKPLDQRPGAPLPAYDPVARIVTLTPAPGTLVADQSYNLVIAGPKDPVNALRAIDGATLAAPVTITFAVMAGGAGATTPLPTVDFCNDVYPVLATRCSYPGCHGGSTPLEGLRLDSTDAIRQSAVGRVSRESNTGPRATTQPPGRVFGVDMPLIDPGNAASAGGNPGNSWLLYKLLLATPGDPGTAATPCGSNSVTDVSTLHSFATSATSPTERAALANYVVGREMPFPGVPATNPSSGLTNDELERISRWIAQPPPAGGLTPTCSCPSINP